MSINFFTDQFGFQKSPSNTPSNLGVNKGYASAVEKNEFKATNSKQNNDVQSSDRNKKFAEMMEAINKKKDSATNMGKTENTSKEATPLPAQITNTKLVIIDDADLKAFQTEQSAIAAQLNNIETGASQDSSLLDLENIAALNEKILQTINEQTQNNDGAANPEILAEQIIESDIPTEQTSSLSDDNIVTDIVTDIQAAEVETPPFQQVTDVKVAEPNVTNPQTTDVTAVKPELEAVASPIILETQITASKNAPIDIDKTESISPLLALIARDENNRDILTPITEKTQDKKAAGDGDLIAVIESINNVVAENDVAAITSNLTAEQITQLQDDIEKYYDEGLSQEDIKSLEALAAQFTVITPPAKPQEKPSIKGANSEPSTILQVPTEKSQTIISKDSSIKDNPIKDRYDARYDAGEKSITPDATEAKPSDKGDFKAAIKDAGLSNGSMNAQNDNAQSAGQRFLQMTSLMQGGTMIEGTAQQIASPTTAQTPLQASLTNVITQSQNAGSNHPATQMVSATIQKALKAGDNTNIKLRLDPPELGRVEVKMSIDKDNVTKIVLTIEKPETYTLLKQDADTLQRALSNAGLDAEGSLNFDLADDSHDFNQGDKQDGNQAGKQANNDNLDNDLIETTMDWQVDPQTGHMRYNALA